MRKSGAIFAVISVSGIVGGAAIDRLDGPDGRDGQTAVEAARCKMPEKRPAVPEMRHYISQHDVCGRTIVCHVRQVRQVRQVR